jgi:hypothetical protein
MSRKFTVKKQLNGPQKYRKWDDYSAGDIFIGTYAGIHKDTVYKKDHFKFKVEACFFKEDAESYVGQTLVLNTCGSLEKAMEEIEEGTTLQIEYLGKDIMAKGPYAGKEAVSLAISIVEEEADEQEDYSGL